MATSFLGVLLALHGVGAVGNFMWGTATASYQVEGYRHADGRQASIWDAFDTDGVSDRFPAVTPKGLPHVYNGESGQFADGDYTRFENSASLVADAGFGLSRLSIAWSRVMTYRRENNSLVRVPNEAGIAHYKKVLQAYTSRGVSVALTIFHWDLPLILEEEAASRECSSYWLCHDLVQETFIQYAELLIQEYSPYVDWWITINEPLTIITAGYSSGGMAPGRCSDRDACYAGNSSVEPYVAAKGLLLGHAAAFNAWVAGGRPGQGCGMTLNCDMMLPSDPSSDADKAAAQRKLEWSVGIFADVIHFGRWPQSVQMGAAGRIPTWTAEEIARVNGSHDKYFFMNSYTTNFVKAQSDAEAGDCGFGCDAKAASSGYSFVTGEPIGTPSSNGWLFNYGPGLGELVAWYNRRYPGLEYVITENGWGTEAKSKQDDLVDTERCNFYRDYLGNLSAAAMREGYKVAAYTAWSLMDNLEWADGYSTRFGMVYVDFKTMERTPKMSYRWLQKYVTNMTELPKDGKPFPPCDATELMGNSQQDIVV